jgi:hypothetical protein
MPKQLTDWSRIIPGDVISFQYKSPTSGKPLRTHTIMVLNPKYPNTLKDGTQKFYVNGLKLEGSNISIFTNKSQAWDLLRSIGWISIRSLRNEIYTVDIKNIYLGTYGAKERLYKELKQSPIGEKAKFRSYDWTVAKTRPCYYEPIKLPKDKIILLEEQRSAHEN